MIAIMNDHSFPQRVFIFITILRLFAQSIFARNFAYGGNNGSHSNTHQQSAKI
jgi:hypothetical protein